MALLLVLMLYFSEVLLVLWSKTPNPLYFIVCFEFSEVTKEHGEYSICNICSVHATVRLISSLDGHAQPFRRPYLSLDCVYVA